MTDGPDGHDGGRFDRLPADPDSRRHEDQPTREEVLEWWDERFAVPPETFDGHGFWEKGRGKIWAFGGRATDPAAIEGLGMVVLRTRGEHWKPTTEAAQRFGNRAGRNVVELGRGEARAFVAGEDQPVDWDGDWGYLIAAHRIAGGTEPLGVGLFLHGELRSQIPKGRRREL